MRILHTSDIHTGRRLKEHERTEEFRKFFCWLESQISNEHIDTLLISGDIFDNTTPSVTAQNIYYSFLARIANSPLRHTVIISGNHDSPSFIDAPSDILKLCKIHVIGQACDNPEDEVIPLYDSDGRLELIICAVPFLRDKDVRRVNADDSFSDIDSTLQLGIKNHYERVFERARSLRGNDDIPIIAMGHLFLKNGKTREGDGVRSLYVGTSVEVGSDIFPEDIAYTALGHLHSPQSIGRENIRYSGSPIAMGFGEAGQKKSVSIIETDGRNFVSVNEIPVPVFQRLERISGSIDELESQISELGHENESVWIEVTHKGELEMNLQERVNECAKFYPNVEIMSIYDESKGPNGNTVDVPNLDSITPDEMLKLCFDFNNTPEEQRQRFIPLYHEILRGLEVDF